MVKTIYTNNGHSQTESFILGRKEYCFIGIVALHEWFWVKLVFSWKCVSFLHTTKSNSSACCLTQTWKFWFPVSEFSTLEQRQVAFSLLQLGCQLLQKATKATCCLELKNNKRRSFLLVHRQNRSIDQKTIEKHWIEQKQENHRSK
jgi:hypothetical protein